VRSLPPATVMAMAEDKGTSTPKQENEPTRRAHIPRVVVVGFWFSLITFSIAVFFFAGGGIDNRAVLWGIRTVAVLAVIVALWRLIRIGYDYQWTGLGEAELPKRENVEFRPKKTVWDWLQLLIVPIVLSLISLGFTWQQDARQQKIEDQRARVERAVEEQRARAEREIQEQRAQHATLEAYLEEMGTLLLDRNLRDSEENSDVRRLARARTLVVLDVLGPTRQERVLRFLSEADLIRPTSPNKPPVVTLRYVHLENAELPHRILLRGADLQQAYLARANLYDIDFRGTILAGAHLEEANLELAELQDADLSGAFLRGADLSGADLTDVDLSNAEGLWEPGTDLWKRGAGLNDADLSNANLSGADLSNANLSGANLSGANLKGADVTEEQLAKCKSLEGATMPDGQKYEDWLKSKGRGEDGENSGPS
jgi:uncharacterized protein YjbI with pentapeptide repeats